MKYLHSFIKNGHVSILKASIAFGADVNSKDQEGCTPLHISVLHHQVDILKHLIAAGADVNARNKKGSTPLHYSIWEDHFDIMNILIGAGADVNAKDGFGFTPLNLSISENQVKYLKILIAAGADVCTKSEGGQNNLHYCAYRNNVEMVNLLIGAGADIHAKDVHGETPLHSSAESLFVTHAEVVKALVAAGADVHAKTMNGRNSLHYSAYRGNVYAVKELIAYGVNVNERDNHRGNTPLHDSAISGNVNVAKLLINAGAYINAQDKRGFTALNVAYECYELEMCKFLIKQTQLCTNASNKPEFENDVDNLNELWDSCGGEVQQLKETFLGNSRISLFIFLTETDVNKIALYSSEENFGIENELGRSLHIKNFPLYAEDIETQFIKGSKRACLLHKSQQLMKGYFLKPLPIHIIRKISEYMENEDLEKVLFSLNFNKNPSTGHPLRNK